MPCCYSLGRGRPTGLPPGSAPAGNRDEGSSVNMVTLQIKDEASVGPKSYVQLELPVPSGDDAAGIFRIFTQFTFRAVLIGSQD